MDMSKKDILNDRNLTDEKEKENTKVFLVLDDVNSKPRFIDPKLKEMFYTGRHYRGVFEL